MTPAETKELLLYIGGGWPEREISEPSEVFWSRQLRAVTLEDAMTAVDALVAAGQVHYPRPAEVLDRCPQPWPHGTLYSRYGELRSKLQGAKQGKAGYRCDGKLMSAQRREYEQLTRQLGVIA